MIRELSMKFFLNKIISALLISSFIILGVSCTNVMIADESSETDMQAETGQTETVQTTITETSQSQTESKPESINGALYEYLADEENGRSAGEAAYELNYDEWHNACVYTVSEALRRVGCDIPLSMCRTDALITELKARGFEVFYDLDMLQPGDICFTTNEAGEISDDPTHVYVFLGWMEEDVANVFDNQVYDYGSEYHSRDMGLTYFNDRQDKPKEATAFFMRK
jgi:hypothetical protein